MYKPKKSKPKPPRKNSSKVKQNNPPKNSRPASYNAAKTPSASSSRKPVIYIRKIPSIGPLGLTSKEKSYVITTCQKHNSRYTKLKALAMDAMKNNKVYVVYGNNHVIRRALNARGWVEKLPLLNMNLSKIHQQGATKVDVSNELEKLLLSNLVERHRPNFMWKVKDYGRYSSELNDQNHTIINKLKMDTVWASKQGLCSSVKNSKWFYVEEVAETYTPRTYNSYDNEDTAEFIADFKLTACTSLLKWMLQATEGEKPLFTSEGKTSLNIIVFALNRCKEFILKKQNKDIDRSWRAVSENMWTVYLKNFNWLISEQEFFEEDKEKKVPLYVEYAKLLLKEMERYRPQMSCEGVHNVWIVKPGHCSRGRGIRIASQLLELNKLLKSNQRRVVQKYIEVPLLIHETKFDIRQYYLVTSTFPLIIWMYKDCYLKFSSQKYALKNFHESIHLTNHAVQKRYKNCQGRHPELPCNNMWSLERYKEYLAGEGMGHAWNELIYPGMKKCIIGVMLSCQEHMSMCKDRFELYGCDFILDNDYRPWLIEINSCPDLNPTTKVTGKICAAVVEDIVKVVIDRPRMIRAGTGNFECVYRQSMTTPTYHRVAELAVRGRGLPNDYFCKSTIVHEPLDPAVDVDRECDIQSTFKQLKALYTEYESDVKTNLEVSPSEEELGQVADVITSQLDVLMEKLPSSPTIEGSENGNTSCGSAVTVVSNSILGEDINSVHSYFSEMDLKSVLHKPVSVQMSTSAIDLHDSVGYNIEQMSCLNVAEKMIRSMSKRITIDSHEHFLENRFSGSRPVLFPGKLKTKSEMQTAASRILNFISRES